MENREINRESTLEALQEAEELLNNESPIPDETRCIMCGKKIQNCDYQRKKFFCRDHHSEKLSPLDKD